MDTVEVYPPPAVKPEPRWAAREDMVDRIPVNDGYRNRRSPGKKSREGDAALQFHALAVASCYFSHTN